MRTRLAVTFALIGLALSAGIGFGVYALTAGALRADVRSTELRRAELAATLYAGSRQVVVGAARDDRSAPAGLQRAVAHGLVGTDLAGSTIWAAAPARGGGIYVEDSAAGTAHTLADLRNILLGVGAAATLLAALAGALIADRLSRPLRRTAAAADRISAGDLNARTGVQGRDEVGRLAAAVDAMAAAVQERILREQRFSADVAHELRTPLTALVTAGSLLDDSRPAQVVRERVGTLRALVEDLLEISRLQQGVAEEIRLEPVALGDFVTRLIQVRDPRAVEVGLEAPATVESDPRRVERVVANLIDNALLHGRPPVVVGVKGTTITVTDAGPGYPPDLLTGGPAPFRTGAAERGTGTGLGLVIALAQAAVLGAHLELANSPAGGAVASLTLNPSPPATLVLSQGD